MANAEAGIVKMEARISEIEAMMGAGDVSPQLLAEYDDVRKRLENEMSIWEMAQMRLDELKS